MRGWERHHANIQVVLQTVSCVREKFLIIMEETLDPLDFINFQPCKCEAAKKEKGTMNTVRQGILLKMAFSSELRKANGRLTATMEQVE
jgi:hypothetical protein